MSGIWAEMNLLDRMVFAVERVRERLMRACAAIGAAGIPYAVIDDHAVRAWVATVDPSAVRNTPDISILLRRADLGAAVKALEAAGFFHLRNGGAETFLDGAEAKKRDAVQIVIAGERVRPGDAEAAPGLSAAKSLVGGEAPVLALPTLVRMLLTSFRLKDKVHLRDMIDVGLLDATWVGRMGPVLGPRLQHLIDTPGE